MTAEITVHIAQADGVLGFDGEPFDVLRWDGPGDPVRHDADVPALGFRGAAPTSPAADQPPPAQGGRPHINPPTEMPPTTGMRPNLGTTPLRRTGDGELQADAAGLVRELRTRLVAAHDAAMLAQTALQRRYLAALGAVDGGSSTDRRPPTPRSGSAAVAPRSPAPLEGPPPRSWERESVGPEWDDEPVSPVDPEAAFKPLARSDKVRLDGADLARLADGDVPGVFGAEHDQDGCNPLIRLAPGGVLLLTEVAELSPSGGPSSRGRVRAACRPPDGGAVAAWASDAVAQAAQVFALHVGLHLCLADAAFASDGEPEVAVAGPLPAGPCELTLDVVDVDLIPRPWVRVNAVLRTGGAPIARVRGLTLAVRERPGAPVGPAQGGTVPYFLGRKNRFGERALLSEFHMTHSSRGDQGVAFGPEFARFTGRLTTRVPCYGLRLVDRVMAVDGERGNRASLDGGASHVTEYDSPADSWYYADTANASMPHIVLMETALQSAVLLGYYLGVTLPFDEDLQVRNLEGHATVLREVDLRDQTIRQDSQLLSTTSMPGSVLQNFGFELSTDGEPFYRGESLFGYFNADALANQTGLDAGRYVPTWLESQEHAPAVRTIDIAARRARGDGPPVSRDHLALLDEVQVVDDGGRYGKGYLHSVRPIDPEDWFFTRHFHMDPVIPGSIGVETVIQALQEWLVDSGLAAGLDAPGFVVPAGVRMAWKYRGQFLPTDGLVTLEAHVKDVVRSPGRVRVVADASVWKPGLRIYQLNDLAVELREAGAAEPRRSGGWGVRPGPSGGLR